ncbi:hypothetical protein MSAN_01682900 [Mycena sanguinolenta]|uniref:MFS general substrate transporter n=1 Tax=Mycena sanguinolenta TaxID=230812 RepID=A0A8H6XZT0_9AGAR|nr:hypothetical protein MSAN_01682900 [Mycena sanguinolenta]
MSSSAHETDPLLLHQPTTDRKPSFAWLIPVVALASICRGISMFTRFEHYQKTFCPDFNYSCGWFAVWLELPSITVMIQTWGVWASFVVSFISIGWWSELGDRRGRKIVMLFSIAGTVFLDLMYLVVANTRLSRDDAEDALSVGLIVEGLLGGFATYNGVVHAYAFDVASSSLSRPVLFGSIDALSFAGFAIGAIIGKFTRYKVSYLFSIIIAIINLAFIYTLLPESHKQQQRTTPRRSMFKSIFSPISVFFRSGQSSKYLPLFGLAFYVYSLTSAMETSLLRFTKSYNRLPGLPPWLLLVGPRVLDLAILLCIFPALAFFWQRKHGRTRAAGLQLALTLSQNSILVAAASCIAILVFCITARTPTPYGEPQLLYTLFAPLYPLGAAIARPALYALGSTVFAAAGHGGEIGVLFGALSVWGELGMYMSYSMYTQHSDIFWFSAFFLVVTLMLLLLDPPPPLVQDEEEGASQAGAGGDSNDVGA